MTLKPPPRIVLTMTEASADAFVTQWCNLLRTADAIGVELNDSDTPLTPRKAEAVARAVARAVAAIVVAEDLMLPGSDGLAEAVAAIGVEPARAAHAVDVICADSRLRDHERPIPTDEAERVVSSLLLSRGLLHRRV